MSEWLASNVVSAGIDYLTASTQSAKRAIEMEKRAFRIVNAFLDRGSRMRDWGMAGYRGWQCEGVQFGVRPDGAVARLSGSTAHTHWRDFYEMADNISRVDYQVTTRNRWPAHVRIGRERKARIQWQRAKAGRPKITTIEDTEGGFVVYIGSRSSGQYGRIYDKGAESKLPEFAECVRHEIEFKGRHAKAAAARVASVSVPEIECIGTCQGWFKIRGYDPRLSPNGYVYRQPSHKSSADRSLEWLAKGVKPTVERLIACGRGKEVLESLGLIAGDDSAFNLDPKFQDD